MPTSSRGYLLAIPKRSAAREPPAINGRRRHRDLAGAHPRIESAMFGQQIMQLIVAHKAEVGEHTASLRPLRLLLG